MEEAGAVAGGVLFGTVSAVTGLGFIEALPGVSGVVDVGRGLGPQAADASTAVKIGSWIASLAETRTDIAPP